MLSFNILCLLLCNLKVLLASKCVLLTFLFLVTYINQKSIGCNKKISPKVIALLNRKSISRLCISPRQVDRLAVRLSSTPSGSQVVRVCNFYQVCSKANIDTNSPARQKGEWASDVRKFSQARHTSLRFPLMDLGHMTTVYRKGVTHL